MPYPQGLDRLRRVMPPKPANDETPPLWPGLSKRAEARLQWAFSLGVIAIIYGSAILWLDAKQWIGIGITLSIAAVFVFSAALWRLIVYGRA